MLRSAFSQLIWTIGRINVHSVRDLSSEALMYESTVKDVPGGSHQKRAVNDRTSGWLQKKSLVHFSSRPPSPVMTVRSRVLCFRGLTFFLSCYRMRRIINANGLTAISESV